MVVDDIGFSQYCYARNVGSWLFISDVKSNCNIGIAVIVSTGLFTFAHGGAFEAGILPVLNVITMSLFVTAVLEYTDSLIAPIVIHFYGMVLVQLFWEEYLWQKIIHIYLTW